jgi:hypothetical protein
MTALRVELGKLRWPVDFLEILLQGAITGIGSYAGCAFLGWFTGYFKTAAGKLNSKDTKALRQNNVSIWWCYTRGWIS